MLSDGATPDRRNVVYVLRCDACEATYIGQTARFLSHRLHEHRHDTVGRTAVGQHTRTTGHQWSFSSYAGSTRWPSHLPALEAMYIMANADATKNGRRCLVNTQNDPRTATLSSAWSQLIPFFKITLDT